MTTNSGRAPKRHRGNATQRWSTGVTRSGMAFRNSNTTMSVSGFTRSGVRFRGNPQPVAIKAVAKEDIVNLHNKVTERFLKDIFPGLSKDNLTNTEKDTKNKHRQTILELLNRHAGYVSATEEHKIHVTHNTNDMIDILALIFLDTLHDNKIERKTGNNEKQEWASGILWVEENLKEGTALFSAIALDADHLNDDPAGYDHYKYYFGDEMMSRNWKTNIGTLREKVIDRVWDLAGKTDNQGKQFIPAVFEKNVLKKMRSSLFKPEVPDSGSVVASFGWEDLPRINSKYPLCIDMGTDLAKIISVRGKQRVTLANLSDAGISFLSQSKLGSHIKQVLETSNYGLSKNEREREKQAWKQQCTDYERPINASQHTRNSKPICEEEIHKRVKKISNMTSNDVSIEWDFLPLQVSFQLDGAKKPWFTYTLQLLTPENLSTELKDAGLAFEKGYGFVTMSIFGYEYQFSILSVKNSRYLMMYQQGEVFEPYELEYEYLTEALFGKFLGDFSQSMTCHATKQLGFVTGDNLAMAMYLLIARVLNKQKGNHKFLGINTSTNVANVDTNYPLFDIFQ